MKLLTEAKEPPKSTIGRATVGKAVLIVFKSGKMTPKTLPKAIPPNKALKTVNIQNQNQLLKVPGNWLNWFKKKKMTEVRVKTNKKYGNKYKILVKKKIPGWYNLLSKSLIKTHFSGFIVAEYKAAPTKKF